MVRDTSVGGLSAYQECSDLVVAYQFYREQLRICEWILETCMVDHSKNKNESMDKTSESGNATLRVCPSRLLRTTSSISPIAREPLTSIQL